MMEHFMQMLGIGSDELNQIKTAVVNFEARFTQLEQKIEAMFQHHLKLQESALAPVIAPTAPNGDQSPEAFFNQHLKGNDDAPGN